MKATIVGGTLILKLHIEEPRPSSTKKTMLIASNHGVRNLAIEYEGKPVSVVANAFVPLDSDDVKGKSTRKHKRDEEEAEDED